MVEVKVCIGSSCFLKQAPKIVEFFDKKIKEDKVEDKVTLSGSICPGKCNRIGVTISINNEVIVGVTPENVEKIWNEKVKPLIY